MSKRRKEAYLLAAALHARRADEVEYELHNAHHPVRVAKIEAKLRAEKASVDFYCQQAGS